MRQLVVPLLAVIVALAGCLGSLEDPAPTSSDDPGTTNTTPPADDGNTTAGQEPQEPPEQPPAEEPAENETAPPPREEPPEEAHAPWPPLAEARIRPGVQLTAGGNGCTTNFIFRTPDNSTLLIGTAAHCVNRGEATETNGCSSANEPLPLGTEVDVVGARQPAILVYSSWETMQRVGETDENACRYNDFALLAIHPEDRGAVHPAMLHFGGPTALARPGQIATLEKLLSYGNSGLRFGVEPTNWHEGYVVFSEPWTMTAYVVTPIIPGDSGSAVITGDGQAAGVAVTVAATPFAASNGITMLATALDYAREKGGVDVELVTFRQLDAGLLP